MIDPLSVRNKHCTLCPLYKEAVNVCVSGEGPPLGRDKEPLPVLILGEAPGREEDALGRPFVGASGKLLRSALRLEKIPYEQCYITNTVKCFPHGTPSSKEISICTKNYLKEEIDLLNPRFILACGTSACSVLVLNKFSEVRGKLCESWLGNALVFPIWHPAYILRNRSKEAVWRNDLSIFRALLEVDLKI